MRANTAPLSGNGFFRPFPHQPPDPSESPAAAGTAGGASKSDRLDKAINESSNANYAVAQDNTATAAIIDPRMAVLGLAAAWHLLVEDGELDVEEAFDRLTNQVASIVPLFRECPTCGRRPCRSESFCAAARNADYRRQKHWGRR